MPESGRTVISVTYVAHSVGRRRAFTTTRSPTGPEEVAAGVVGVAAMRRVAVTGLGVVAPNGVGKEAFWSACVDGQSGVRPISSFDASAHPVPVAAEVPEFDVTPFVPPPHRKSLKIMGRAARFGVAAAGLAVRDSGLDLARGDPERAGVIMGTGVVPMDLPEVAPIIGPAYGEDGVLHSDHAGRRGATIYAEVLGLGSSFDAYAVTRPDPEAAGAARAIRWALREARVDPAEVDYINAHGTSTRLNDQMETMAVKRVFNGGARLLPLSSIKSMIGHLIGAAGAVEAVALALTLRDGAVPPTINYHQRDPSCDLDYVPN